MLLCWGANSHGQLGLGYSSEQEAVPQRLSPPRPLATVVGGGGHTLALDSAGALFGCGWNQAGQLGLPEPAAVSRFCRVDGVPAASAVAAGWDFSLALLTDGSVVAAGSNRYGQLGR